LPVALNVWTRKNWSILVLSVTSLWIFPFSLVIASLSRDFVGFICKITEVPSREILVEFRCSFDTQLTNFKIVSKDFQFKLDLIDFIAIPIYFKEANKPSAFSFESFTQQ